MVWLLNESVKSMRAINMGELSRHLRKYLKLATRGEQIVICNRNLPVAKLIPFSAGQAKHEELLLVATGKMRMPKRSVTLDELIEVPTGSVAGNEGVRALLEDRAEGL